MRSVVVFLENKVQESLEPGHHVDDLAVRPR